MILLAAAALLMVAAFSQTRSAHSSDATPAATADAVTPGLLFDDFNYSSADDAAFKTNGWIVRTEKGWPGIPGATWGDGTVTFVEDSGNHMMQLNSATDGTPAHTTQAQVCQQRKFFEGTYAAHVKFNDKPDQGPGGDNIVETFYQIAPYVKPMDPTYSEMDFEYLPNGGWGNPSHFFAWTTWYTVQIEPWNADNQSQSHAASFDGWHTLVLQVADGKVAYYVDGKLMTTHTGKYYPRQPMSMNFNLWFIDGGTLKSSDMRRYTEQIDWAFYAANMALDPTQVDSQVAALRANQVSFTDGVVAPSPALDSPCNL
jgi:hypothetical protein